MAFYKYPHTDLNQQNLDWIVTTLKELQQQIASGTAGIQVITLAADMTDHAIIYVYQGSEAGYNYNHWYYWDSGVEVWTDGGAWGFDNALLPLAISNGGTGAVNAAGARSALGITPAAIGAVPQSDLPLSLANGGTGSTNASDARTALEITPAHIGAVATSSLPLAVTDGGTGSTTAADARTALGITPANIGAVATSDLPLSVANGGTGAATASAARTSLKALTTGDFVVEDLSGAATTAAAGAQVHVEIDITKSGYTPIGIISFYGTGTKYFSWTDLYYSTSPLKAHCYLTNNSASSQTVTPKIGVLYVKNLS